MSDIRTYSFSQLTDVILEITLTL